MTEFLPQSSRVYMPDGVAPAMQSVASKRGGNHAPQILAVDTYNQTVSDKAQTLCSRGDTPGGNAHLVPAVLAYGGNNTAGPIDTAACPTAHPSRIDFESETFIAFAPEVAGTLVGRSIRGGGQTNSPGHNADESVIAFNARQDPDTWVERTGPLDTDGSTQAVMPAAGDGRQRPAAAGVRRLTPRECERLQGFPDDFTLIPWRGKPAEECPDGPRYKAIGNSWAVDCVEWIAARLTASREPSQEAA